MSNEKKASNKRLIEMEFSIQNENVSMQARNKINNSVKEPMKPMDAELVREYKSLFPTSYENTDPETGEITYKKYRLPEAEPELEEIDEYFSKDDLNESLKDIEEENKVGVETIKRLKYEMYDLWDEKIRIKDDIDNGVAISEEGHEYITDIDYAIGNLRELIKDGEDYLLYCQTKKRDLREKYDIDVKRVNIIKKDNFDKVEGYKNMLNDLNKNAFNTEKQPDESNEEYMQRLKDNAQIEAHETEIDDAKVFALKEFKDKIKELIRNNGIIEQVCNSFEPNDKIILIKFWTVIRKKYLDLYGVNNSKVNASDIITVLTHYLKNDPSNMNIDNNKEFSDENELENEIHTNKNVKITHDKINNCLILQNPPSDKHSQLFLKVLNISSEKALAKDEYVLLYSFSGEKGSYTQWIDFLSYTSKKKAESSSITIYKETGIDKALLISLFKASTPLKISIELINTYNIHALSLRDVQSKQIQLTKKALYNSKKTTIYGYGLKPNENIHEFVHFGKLLLKQKSLYYKNILSVKQSNKLSIQGFQNVKVSDSFVKIIMNMLEHINPNSQDIERLNTNERHLYDRLIVSSGLHKDLGVFHKGENTVQEMKDRLKLIEGEIEIGNNSPLLIKEIHKIIYTLRDMRAISSLQTKQYLNQF